MDGCHTPATHDTPAIMGASELAPKRRYGESLTQMHILTGMEAIRDAGLALDEVEGLLVVQPLSTDGPVLLSEEVKDYFGFKRLRHELTVNLGGASHLAMLRHAADVITSGIVENVLCVSAGKFPAIRLMDIRCERAIATSGRLAMHYEPYSTGKRLNWRFPHTHNTKIGKRATWTISSIRP